MRVGIGVAETDDVGAGVAVASTGVAVGSAVGAAVGVGNVVLSVGVGVRVGEIDGSMN